jgi:hypothetical protein
MGMMAGAGGIKEPAGSQQIKIRARVVPAINEAFPGAFGCLYLLAYKMTPMT